MIANHLRTEFESDSQVGVAYVYCDLTMAPTKQHSAENILASLWRDLAFDNGSLSSFVEKIFEKNRGRSSRPSLDDVSEALYIEIRKYSKVFIILDALDEITSPKTQKDLLNKFLALPSNAKLMITSRLNLDIERDVARNERFSSLRVTRVEVRAVDSDIQKFIRGQMEDFQDFVREDTELQKRIIDTIISCTEGM